MLPEIPGYRLERSIEPEHARSTWSDSVYLATQLSSGAPVALKILQVDFPLYAEGAELFRATMRKVGALRNSAAIPLRDMGLHGNAPWFALAQVEGETVAAAIARGRRFTLAEVRQLFAQIVPLLVELHAAGLDDELAARHLMLTTSGPRLWNFGVQQWRLAAHALVAGQYLNVGGLHWFCDITPALARGLPWTRAHTPATMALIAFTMLTGRHYWNADENPQATVIDLLREATQPIAAPSTRARVPPGFDKLFLRAVAGEFPNVAEALAAF